MAKGHYIVEMLHYHRNVPSVIKPSRGPLKQIGPSSSTNSHGQFYQIAVPVVIPRMSHPPLPRPSQPPSHPTTAVLPPALVTAIATWSPIIRAKPMYQTFTEGRRPSHDCGVLHFQAHKHMKFCTLYSKRRIRCRRPG